MMFMMMMMMVIRSMLMIMLYDREIEVDDENYCSAEKSKTTESNSFLIR